MPSSPPPSSRSRLTGDVALEPARGQLRDALAGLRNLDQLLRSLRVGPRALASVIPDAHASCGVMRAAVLELLSALGARIPHEVHAIDGLRDFVLPRIAELEAALAKAESRSLTAKNRLTLERVVAPATRDLEGARELLDLLEQATSAPSIRFDLTELLQQTFKAGDASDGSKQQASLDLPSESVELLVSPRVLMALFTLAAQLTADGGAVRVTLSMEPSGACSVNIAPEPRPAASSSSAGKRGLAPVAACIEAAARQMGAEFEHQPGAPGVRFVWPSSIGAARAAPPA